MPMSCHSGTPEKAKAPEPENDNHRKTYAEVIPKAKLRLASCNGNNSHAQQDEEGLWVASSLTKQLVPREYHAWPLTATQDALGHF